MKRNVKAESDWPELEKALHLSTDDLEEKCEEEDRKFAEAIRALIGDTGAKG